MHGILQNHKTHIGSQFLNLSNPLLAHLHKIFHCFIHGFLIRNN